MIERNSDSQECILRDILGKANQGQRRDQWLSGIGSDREDLDAEAQGTGWWCCSMMAVAVSSCYVNSTSMNISLKHLHTHFATYKQSDLTWKRALSSLPFPPLLNKQSLGCHDLILFTIVTTLGAQLCGIHGDW